MVVLDPCSVATHTVPLLSASPLSTPRVARAGDCSFDAQAMLASTIPLLIRREVKAGRGKGTRGRRVE
ncbi:hypothetical protein BLNAU_7529 [Blattamonas nauphoetae]|uniref:Uncharacterized protein n=1 Tax=Blattamonas nauphoetae TaxID=2049346 RepID=A0ABQ9Y1L5_9EUKA|nr:hypothetical protein BLNAU_7529 [Blattamonas nauphoetae]